MTLTRQVDVFRTGRTHEILMVLNELKAAGVPAYGQQEVGGIVTAMQATPLPGPDVMWIVRVPEPAAEDARGIIRQLPVDSEQSPGIWHFGPGKSHRKLIWTIAVIFLAMAFFGLIGDIVELFSQF